MTRALTFDNMIPAIAVFNATKNALYLELENMATTGDVTDFAFAEWEAKLKANEETIREAYYLDTSDRNSRNSLAMTSAESLVALTEKILHGHSK